MKRHALCLFGLLALVPAGPVMAQAAAPAAFAGGVKALVALDYDGMSRDAITRATGWPLAVPYQVWSYGGKRYKGLAYLYGGNNAGANFAVDFDEAYVDKAHHFAVRLLTDHATDAKGGNCLPIRDLRQYAAAQGWTDVETYGAMLAHGFTARKGRLLLDARVDTGNGATAAEVPGLDDQGCVQGVLIKDVAGGS